MSQPAAFVPQFQVLGWMWCKTCQRYPWDCTCRVWICTSCELGPEDALAVGPVCGETGGEHTWKEIEPDGG